MPAREPGPPRRFPAAPARTGRAECRTSSVAIARAARNETSLTDRSTILYVTDLAYQAPGRRYCDEDIGLSERLRGPFAVALCHPKDVVTLMDGFDAVVVRNCGPGWQYDASFGAVRERALNAGARVYNTPSGKADMAGKQYLLDLYARGYPVIPTVERVDELDRLPHSERYLVKPKTGADSRGIEILTARDLARADRAFDGLLIQPLIDFAYEVSFYFIDGALQYALYAPRPAERWKLERYEPTPADAAFARRFIAWNALAHGIQRVDACRTRGGELLLVEVEDHNPYLSLDLLDDAAREAFVANLTASLRRLLADEPAVARPGPGSAVARAEHPSAAGD